MAKKKDTKKKPKAKATTFKPGQSGNPGGRPKGAKSVTTKIQQAISEAIDGLEKEGKPLAEIIKACLRKSPVPTLKAIAPFVPKQIEASITFEDLLHELEGGDGE